jgi:hypothetical protein
MSEENQGDDFFTTETEPEPPPAPAPEAGKGSTTAIEILETQIHFIPLGDDEHLAHVIGRLQTLKARVRELDQMYKDKLLERIDEHGPVTIGQIRYYAGFEAETISLNSVDVLDALFTAVGGDMQQVANCLCSQPFKPGACRSVLPPEQFNLLFSTVEKKKAKEGKPVRKVLAANLQFSK